MATNTFVSDRDVVDLGLKLLDREITLPKLFWKNPISDWTGREGDAVNVRIPTRMSGARRFGTSWRPGQDIGPSDGTTPPYGGDHTGTDSSASLTYGNRPSIVVDTFSETTINLKIDDFFYKAVGLTEEQLTLDLRNFAAQVLNPQVRTMTDYVQAKCATVMSGANYAADNQVVAATVAADGTNDQKAAAIIAAVFQARKVLTDAGVPLDGRTLVVSSDVEMALLLSDKFQRVDSVGNASALREATIGRIAGMDVVVDRNIPEKHAYLLHNTAFVLSLIAPVVPSGAPQGRSLANPELGTAMLWVRDYDTNHMIDRSVVSCFAGAQAVEDGPVDTNGNRTLVRAVSLDLSPALPDPATGE